MTRLHLVRHGSHGLLGRVLTGRMDGVGLSAEGHAQAEALAGSLGQRPIAGMFSSPLQRARETAQPLAGRLGLAVEVDAGLDEVDFGEWTGLAFSALEGRPAWDAWNRARSVAPCPGGETMLAAQARIVGAMSRLAAAHPGGEVVLVSHQDVLKSALAHMLGMPLDHLGRLALDPAHRITVGLSETEILVEAMNLPP